MMRHAMTMKCALLLALACLPPGALAQKHKDVEEIGARDINRGSWNFYSIEREIELGRQLAGQVESTSLLLRDREVQAYVNELVQRLVRNSDAQLPFTVRVIDSDEINAFALPGGFVYVNTGLILEAQTEAELAGVLAHEIAHVTARHATKRATKATLFRWFTLPLIFVGGPIGLAVQQGLGLAVPLTFLKFARGAEREADYLGLQYTYSSGYDPLALIDFLERLSEHERKGNLPKVFSSHPMSKERIKRAQEEIAQVLPARTDYVVSTSRFDQVKARLLHWRHVNSLYEPSEQGGPRLRRRTQESQP